jgi:hypothetical protein
MQHFHAFPAGKGRQGNTFDGRKVEKGAPSAPGIGIGSQADIGCNAVDLDIGDASLQGLVSRIQSANIHADPPEGVGDRILLVVITAVSFLEGIDENQGLLLRARNHRRSAM